MIESEKKHLDKMVKTYKEYLTAKSWKRRRDLKKALAGLERDWFEYLRIRQEERKSAGSRNAFNQNKAV